MWNQFTIRVPGGRRDALQQFLSERKIGSAVYYPIPLHLQKCFADLRLPSAASLPVSEQAAEEVLSLPIYPEMTRDEQDRVIGAIAEFCGVAAKPATAGGVESLAAKKARRDAKKNRTKE